MYRIVTGDTFEAISRKVYGTEAGVDLLQSANPGVSEPLSAGTSLVTPVDPAAPARFQQDGPANSPDEVAIKIAGERFRFWESVTIERQADGLATVDFTAPFEADNQKFRQIFRPLSYQTVEITVGGEPFFSGVMLSPLPDLKPDRRTVSVSCYSLPGVLQDCTAAASSYPIEFDGYNFQQIAQALIRPFGLSVEFAADPGPAFERVALEPDQKVWGFLVKLAQQRNLILSDTPSGALRVGQSGETGHPVAILRQGEAPLGEVAPNFRPQQYYSHVTGLQPAMTGVDGSQFTVKNGLLPDAVRPFTFKGDDTTPGDIKAAVEAKAGRMVAGSASYSVPVAAWRDPTGRLWTPNTTIKLLAPGAMIYTPYEFLIRKVTLNATADRRDAVLGLVLPGVFSGVLPESLPWD